MRDHLKRVLDIARPYRGRLVLGLLCGFLSGALAPTLALSLKLAVDAVFPTEKSEVKSAMATQPADKSSPQNTTIAQAPSGTISSGLSSKGMASRMPSGLKNALDRLSAWVRPAGPPSRTRLLLVIGFIPASM